jgi:hypothetical protein
MLVCFNGQYALGLGRTTSSSRSTVYRMEAREKALLICRVVEKDEYQARHSSTGQDASIPLTAAVELSVKKSLSGSTSIGSTLLRLQRTPKHRNQVNLTLGQIVWHA